MNNLTSHILFKKYNKVQKLCQALLKLGIVGFIYMRRYPDGRFIDLSNQIDWASFFLTKYFEGKYPVEIAANHMLIEKGVLFWSLDTDNPVWQEGEKIFGFGNGITISLKKEGYCEIFCFYGKASDTHLNKFYAQYFSLLEKFIQYFKENMNADILEAKEKNDFLITPHKYLESRKDALLNGKYRNFLKDIKYTDRINLLSSREQDCAIICASGKTAKEVAQCLNLSPRTVEMHLSRAKEKLECKNLRELCQIFVAENFIGI